MWLRRLGTLTAKIHPAEEELMVYSNSWDEAAPPGTDLANTLDTIIQNKMIDIRQRIEQVIPDWADDAVDPKRAVIYSGTVANRPDTADANAGEFFYATDEQILYLFDGTAWITITDLITAPASGPVHRHFQYDDSQAVGSKQIGSQTVGRIVTGVFTGTTDVSGIVSIDAGEIDSVTSWSSLVAGVFTGTMPTNLMQITYATSTASVLNLYCLDEDAFALATTAVIFQAVFFFGDLVIF